jgi:hypothetical protein
MLSLRSEAAEAKRTGESKVKTRKLVFGGALTAVSILALGSIGFAVAQSGGTPGDAGAHGAMAGHEQMGNHADMAGHESMGAMGGMSGHGGEQQARMHEAAATALGITAAELDAQLASGKTIADIATAKGIDLATLQTSLHASMQGAHPGDHGAGMGTGGMTGGPQHS